MGKCPCCVGKTTGDWFDLCDPCLGAGLGGGCHHLPAEPQDDVEALAANPVHVLKVKPVRHERGRAWHWKAAIEGYAAGCPLCRPSVPCWRHANPKVTLVGLKDSLGGPALDPRCFSGLARDACTGEGRVTAYLKRGKGMVGSACEPCVAVYLGPVLDPKAVTRG